MHGEHKFWKLILVNILVFALSIIMLTKTDINPEMIWPEAITFFSMEVGLLLGRKHDKKGH